METQVDQYELARKWAKETGRTHYVNRLLERGEEVLYAHKWRYGNAVAAVHPDGEVELYVQDPLWWNRSAA